MSQKLLQLEEATDRLRPSHRRYVGVRPIEVEKIVGTDSRAGDFDREFRARRRDVRERQRRVRDAFPDGAFPPITVYKLGDAYFVIDGHHRVAIARKYGTAMIDAEIVELTARWHLGADADAVELVHAEQERLFMTESGLAQARPDAHIRFSRAVGYAQLLETIQVHGYRLMLKESRAFDPSDVARDWYSKIYLPMLELVHDERLDEVCPGATESDRFLWLNEQRRELAVDHGAEELSAAALRALQQAARRRRGVGRLRRRA